MARPARRLVLPLLLIVPLALSLAQRAQPALAGVPPICTSPDTFAFTGAEQRCDIPAGASSVTITAIGAAGGSSSFSGPGGKSDSVTATFSIGSSGTFTAGQTLYVEVGGSGGNGSSSVTGAGGFNGGGSGGDCCNKGGGGGGGSDVRTLPRTSGSTLSSRVLVAGGGGGAGGFNSSAGGGGGNAGQPGSTPSGTCDGLSGPGSGGTAGTASAGGTGGTTCGAGSVINGGDGALGSGGGGGSNDGGGGGGGGGYYGGGGGGGGGGAPGGGGGGGADFEAAGATGIAVLPGVRFAPSVTLTFTFATTTSLTSSLNPSQAGQPVTFTATVACPGATPTGMVTFSDGRTVLATVSLNGGVATFTTSSLSAGSHPITAVYSGDANCLASTSTVLTQVVGAVNAPTLSCTPPNPPAGSATTCILAFPGPLLPGTTIALNVTNPPGATITGCSNPSGGLVCGSLAGAGLTLTCPSGCSGAFVQLTLLSPVPGALALSVTITQAGPPLQTVVLDGVTWGSVPLPAVSTQPTSEVKYCNNTAITNGLSQTLGGTTQSLVFAGPATTFTLPLFGPASTCILQPQRVVAGAATNCGTTAGTAPCADGYLVVTLTTPGSGAALSCATALTGGVPAGTAVTVATNNGGTCQPQVQGTQLNLPCGLTAGTAAASTTVSNTCTNVLFDISAVLGACVNTPAVCVNPGTIASANALGLNTGSATVTVTFLATPANSPQANTVGGIQLGQNTFSFAGPGTGTLLVAASPQLIPPNGTEASVVSATFACTTGFTSIGGFPLSNTATAANSVLSVGANGQIVVNGNGSCGAGLPGTFTFASPGPVLFDNGRSTEQVSCGPNGNVNAFGNGVSPFFAPTGSTFPLAFTCTGAAVLAIGAGVAGDAPMNVTYASAVGGLQAVGSTLLTVSPAGIPRLSVACNPSSISAGNTGSLCTATVTDINGVPLSGITGATVTFATSDTSTTSILPCTLGTPGAINITTSPAVLPLVTPQTPCATPSSALPAQVNTFLNGQATALLVASGTAHPEVVTVTAALGVLVPPTFACLVSPYAPSGFGTTPGQPGYYAPTSGTGVFGCGSATPIGTTGLGTAFNAASSGFTGVVHLPNASSAATTVSVGGASGIQIAGATAISPVVLSRGCNAVVVTSSAGTPLAQLAGRVSPAAAMVSIWRFDNGSKLFRAGWFADNAAPTDFAVTGAAANLTPGPPSAGSGQSFPTGAGVTGPQADVTETYFVCTNQPAPIR